MPLVALTLTAVASTATPDLPHTTFRRGCLGFPGLSCRLASSVHREERLCDGAAETICAWIKHRIWCCNWDRGGFFCRSVRGRGVSRKRCWNSHSTPVRSASQSWKIVRHFGEKRIRYVFFFFYCTKPKSHNSNCWWKFEKTSQMSLLGGPIRRCSVMETMYSHQCLDGCMMRGIKLIVKGCKLR